MKPLGDRRSRIRLEVVGALWGTLEVDREARILNISRSGALIASPVPAAVDTTQAVRLLLRGHDIKVRARVRHLAPAPEAIDGSPLYQIGLEFLDPPLTLLHALG